MKNKIVQLVFLLVTIFLVSACSETTSNNGVGGDGINEQVVATNGTNMQMEYSVSSNARGLNTGFVLETASQGIWVSGSGSVTIEPDIATIRLGVEVLDDKVSDAKRRAANSSSKVLQAVKSSGVADKDIQTSNLSIQPRYEYKSNGRELIGYVVSWDITVTVLDLDEIETLIDKAVTAGEENITISSIYFQSKNRKTAESEARAIAVKEAIDHAQEIATAAGVNLGRPYFISESSSSPVSSDYYGGMAMASMERSMAIPVESGSLEIVVSVQARFFIE
ncbi:MAG: SIMPL domain-containing protein [Dehalococcoidia bacterium]|tara:strand:- start:30 stop:866 length:837 start_codon:yes stop_codon:yes gene_type:complete